MGIRRVWRDRAAVVAVLGVAALAGPADGREAPVRTSSPNVCLPDSPSRGWCGDHGAADQALLAGPRDVSPLPGGGFLIADSFNHVVRRVDAAGTITTVAGNGEAAKGPAADGVQAGRMSLADPRAVSAITDTAYLVADTAMGVVYRVASDGTTHPVAGRGPAAADATASRLGPADGTRAVDAVLEPTDVVAMPGGGFLVADARSGVVYSVDAGGTIRSVGRGLGEPAQISPEASGSLLVADRRDGRVLRVGADGSVTTLAGGLGPTPARSLLFDRLSAVAATPDGGFLVGDRARVLLVSPDGTVTPAAGTGRAGHTSDAGVATALPLGQVESIARRDDGGLLIADAANDRVVEVRVAAGADGVVPIVGRAAGAGRPASSPSQTPAQARPGTYTSVYNYLYTTPATSPLPARTAHAFGFYVSTSNDAQVSAVVFRGRRVFGRRSRVVRAGTRWFALPLSHAARGSDQLLLRGRSLGTGASRRHVRAVRVR